MKEKKEEEEDFRVTNATPVESAWLQKYQLESHANIYLVNKATDSRN